MTANERVNAHLAELMHGLAGTAIEPLDEVLRQTARMRQRPAWTFPERWLPMIDVTARPLVFSNRPLLIALLALLALVGAVVAAGLWRQPDVPLPASVSIESAARERLEIEAAVVPAAGQGSLWFIIGGAGIGRVDPASGALLDLTQIDAGPCGFLEFAFDRIWVPTCATGGVASIDAGGRLAVIPFDMASTDEEATIGADADSLWLVAGALGDTLVRLDPVAGRVVATYDLGTAAASPEPAFGSIWVAGRMTDQVLRIDPATGTTQATIAVGSQPRQIAVGGDAVWVLNQLDGTVSRIDPSSNTVVATIEVGDLANAPDIEVAGGSVWVRGLDAVSRIDAATNRVAEIFGPVPGQGALTTDGTSVWVTAPDVGLVWAIPAERGESNP